MTRTEAKRRLCASLAASLQGDLDNGSGFLFLDGAGEDLSDDDVRRMLDAARELMIELRRRSAAPRRKPRRPP